LFRRVFDSLEEPVLMFQDGQPIYANGMFFAKLSTPISKAKVEEIIDEPAQTPSLWSRIKPRCCCRKKQTTTSKFVSSFFTEPLFKDFALESDPLKSPKNKKCHSIMGILSLEKEKLATTGFLVNL